MKIVDDILRDVEKELTGSKHSVDLKNVGYVREIKDEVVFIEGLLDSPYGELVEFKDGITGMIIDLFEDVVGAIVFGDYTTIKEGDTVKGTGDVFKIPVSDEYMGRVVDGIARPISHGCGLDSSILVGLPLC